MLNDPLDLLVETLAFVIATGIVAVLLPLAVGVIVAGWLMEKAREAKWRADYTWS